MEPQENKRIALQKAISAHEQAEAALADLSTGQADPTYAALLERIRENIAQLRAESQATDPADEV